MSLLFRLARPSVAGPLLVALSLLVSAALSGDRLGGNDEGAMLTAASRILDGGVFYRDIDAYPLPGSHYVLAAAMGLFGEHIAVARALAAFNFAGIVASLYAAAVVLIGPLRAFVFGLALLSFKLLAWPAFTGFYYWDFAFLGACVCTAALVRAPSTRVLLVAGLGAGVAVMAKQSLGLYVGAVAVGLLVFPKSAAPRLSHLWVFASGAGIAVLPLTAYLTAQGLLGEMLYSGLVRPFTEYAGTSGLAFSVPLRWWEFGSLVGSKGAFVYLPEPLWNLMYREILPGAGGTGAVAWLVEWFVRALYTSVPLVGALAVWVLLRGRVSARAPFVALLGLTGAAVLSAFPRADFTHVISVYPLVLLLGLAGAGWAIPARWLQRLVGLEALSTVAVLAVCASLAVMQHASLTARIELPRASLRVAPEDAFVGAVVRHVQVHVAAGEPLFVYGNEAFYYFLADRYSPWRFSQLYPGQSGERAGLELTEVLGLARPKRVIRGFVRFPGVPGVPDYAPELDAFIRRRYAPEAGVFDAGVAPRPRFIAVLKPRVTPRAVPAPRS